MIFYRKPEYLKTIRPRQTYRVKDIPAVETSDCQHLCKEPLVSVIVATYNQEKFIRDALDSVLMQNTNFKYEVLVGDDCSTDQTGKVCAEYQRRYPERVRFITAGINVSKVGGNVARLSCRARGKYIARLEGDDFWTDPNKLQKQFDVLENHPEVGICFCLHRRLELDGRCVSGRNSYFDGILRSRGDGKGAVFTGDDFFTAPLGVPIGVVMYRKGIVSYEEVNLFHKPTSFILYYLILKKSMGYLIDQEMVTYRINLQGIWSGRSSLDQARISYELYEQMMLHDPASRCIRNLRDIAWQRFRVYVFPYAIYYTARIFGGQIFRRIKKMIPGLG